MKFIAPFTEIEQQTLQEAYRNHPSFRSRQRTYALEIIVAIASESYVSF